MDRPTAEDHRSDTGEPARVRRFRELLERSQSTHLADNLDTFSYPLGHRLPDPSTASERLDTAWDVLERAGVLWDRLGDEASRELFLRILAYRALGPAHVRLQLDPIEYRETVVSMGAVAWESACVVSLPRGVPLESQLHLFNMQRYGLPLRLIGQQLPIAQTLVLSQYAYRDAATLCRPWEGDVAVDVGGCWGETALWLAHQVGALGEVHSFEPSAFNMSILQKNVELNPAFGDRIRLWQQVLADELGRRIWMSDGFGATLRMKSVQDPEKVLAEKQTLTLDNLVDSGQLARVDFLKLDVEGAELDVLTGAAETIRRFQPRLAIAAYHKRDDLVTIPNLIDSFGLDYRWYLQASTLTDIDFVAFAIPAARAQP